MSDRACRGTARTHSGGSSPAVRQIDRLGRDLGREAKKVGRHRSGWDNAAAGLPGQRLGDLVHAGSDFDAEPRIEAGNIVEPASEPFYGPALHQSRQRLIDRGAAAEVQEILARVDLVPA